MLIHLQIATAHRLKRYACVMRQLPQHVVKESESRVHLRLCTAIQIYGYANICLRGLTLHNGDPVGATQKLRNLSPMGCYKHTSRSERLAFEHCLALCLRTQKDSLCTEVIGQLNIRSTVAHNIRRRHIIIARKILAKHAHLGFACR